MLHFISLHLGTGPRWGCATFKWIMRHGSITVRRNSLLRSLGASVQVDTKVKKGRYQLPEGGIKLCDCPTVKWQLKIICCTLEWGWERTTSKSCKKGLAWVALLGGHHGHHYCILAFLTLQPGNMSLTPAMMPWRPQLFTSLWRSKAKGHDLCHRKAHCQNEQGLKDWADWKIKFRLPGRNKDLEKMGKINLECVLFGHTRGSDNFLAERLVKLIPSCKVSLSDW